MDPESTPLINEGAPCPCGADDTLGACCLPYIRAARPAPTPQALMRSRFTALAIGAIDHILATQSDERTAQSPRHALEAWSASVNWERLEVVDSSVNEASAKGYVEFRAHYSEGGIEKIHCEHSEFTRQGDRWIYNRALKRKLISPKLEKEESSIGRNDPCPCGSGKKYKKCCLPSS